MDEPATSREVARRLAAVCRRNSCRLIPVINVLAHQSAIWKPDQKQGMLRAYPDMEELFEGELHSSRCLCTRHPRVRPIVADMIKDLVEGFDTDIVHIGMDEVWDMGKCPRCKGVPVETLFAEYVADVNGYVRKAGATAWMWADRLVDGYLVPTQNPGYESSLDGMHRALAWLPKDIVMCDWHYFDEPWGQLAPSYWAMQGFPFVCCTYDNIRAAEQLAYATNVVRSARSLGMMLTTWCPIETFMQAVQDGLPGWKSGGSLMQPDEAPDKHGRVARRTANVFFKMFVGPG